MRTKAWLLGCLLLAMLLAVVGMMSVQPIESAQELGMTVDTTTIQTEEPIHIRDKNLIYNSQNDTEIVTMYLTVYTGNASEQTNHTWEEINTYSVFDYEDMGVDRYQVSGLLQVGDETGLIQGELGYGQVAPNCTVQIRGQTSSKNVQKNYKISLRENKGDWRGQTTIALNKHQGDGLRYRNKLGFDLLRGIDELFSLRTTFVHLYVRDMSTGDDNAVFEDYGLYTQVEQLNKTALERHGLDKRGHLYKINVCEFYRYEDVIRLKDDPNYDLQAFEEILEIKGDDDHTKLIDLLEKINDHMVPTEEIIEKHFDIENVAYWMAYNILIGNIDTQNRNFYLYSPQNSERWYILPWDIDGMFKMEETTVLERSDYQEWERGASNYWGNMLFRRFLKSETYREELNRAIEDIYAYLTGGRLEELVATYAALVKPYLYSFPDSTYAPLTSAEYDRVTAAIIDEVHSNYNTYYATYHKPMPFFIGDMVKTDTGYSIEWESSYDFNRENITYTFELANDFLFEDLIVKQEGLAIPMTEFGALPAGQYFVRVRAYNESGYSQYAFDYYSIPRDGVEGITGGKLYGIRTFFVDNQGNVVGDTDVE